MKRIKIRAGIPPYVTDETICEVLKKTEIILLDLFKKFARKVRR